LPTVLSHPPPSCACRPTLSCWRWGSQPRSRLQVKRGIRAHGIYKALGFREWQPWRLSPPWSEQRPDHGFKVALFMHATAGEVLAKATAHLVAKQRELRHWRIWRQATYPIPGVELGYTAARLHAQPEAEVAQGEDTAFSPVRRTLRSGSTREGPYQRPPQPRTTSHGGRAIPAPAAASATSHGGEHCA